MTEKASPSYLLYYCPKMESLARRIVAKNESIRLGDISWQLFPDDFQNTYVSKFHGIRHLEAVAFLAYLENRGDVFEQLSAAITIAGYGVSRFRFILPFFPTATMERADDEGQVVTADTLAQFISLLPSCSRPEVVIYDIHALQIKSYFGKHLVVRIKSAVKYFLRVLEGLGEVAVCFPDYGSRKRFSKLYGRYPQIVCEKIRGIGAESDKRVVSIIEGDPRGKHVVIVDDAIMTGGTTLECRKVLMAAGAVKVSAIATHGRFAQDSWRKFVGAGFERIWVTDSCPIQAAAIAGIDPFQVVTLEDDIAKVIITDDDGLATE